MSESQEIVEDKKTLPYGSVSWFEEFLSLAQRIQISSVDNAFLKVHKIASKNEGKVVTGLKTLKLIDQQGKANENMAKLHVVGDAYKNNLKEIVEEAYSVLLSKIDINTALADDLVNTIITEYKSTRRSAEQSAKIFIYLADQSGIAISENLATLRRKAKGKQKTKGIKKGTKVKVDVPNKPELPIEDIPPTKGMHKIAWGDDVLIWLKNDDIKVAKKAIALINLFIEDLEE